MPHYDLFYDEEDYRRHNRHTVQEPVPAWAVEIYDQLALIVKEIRMTKQTTTDIVNVVNALLANSQKWDDALDAAVKAQDGSDDAALATALAQLQTLKTDQDTHLEKLTTVVPPVVAAPADPAPVAISNPPTA